VYYKSVRKGDLTMKRNWIGRLAAVTAAFWLAGCALMVHGQRQNVSVATEPPGASVIISGQQVSSPGEVNLLRNRDYQVVASWPGGRTATATIYSEFSWVTVFNLVPVVGQAVDFLTGAAWELDPDVVTLREGP
jgi:hypothetical protein